MKIFFSKHKKKIALLLSLSVVTVLFFYPNITLANGNAVSTVVGWILIPIISLVSKLAILFLDLLVGLAQYNNFIGSSAVSYGWIVVRDLCNMFFVLILLIIAFASILRIENYNLKTWLPKLVIMAILINFSKMICGVLIDFAQVIMLTFINAIKDIAGGNMTEMLGINKIVVNSKTVSNDDIVNPSSIVGSLFLALIMVIIAMVVILVILITLVIRMVMLWIYIVLSPLAYLLASFPQGASYSQRWWSDFSKNLIVGPILAFFLWLSFASMGSINSSTDIEAMKTKNNIDSESGEVSSSTSNDLAAAATQAGSKDNMILFIVSIGMLLGGLMISQEMGGIAGKVAGTAMAKLQSAGTGTLKLAKRATGIQRAQDAIKSYRQDRQSLRAERAKSDGKLIAKGVGGIKKGITALPNAAGKGLTNIIKGSASQKNIDKTRKEIEGNREKKMKLENLKVEIENFEKNNPGLNKMKEKNGEIADIERRFERGDINQDQAEKEFKEVNEKYNKDKEYLEAKEKEPMLNKQKEAFAKEYNEITGKGVKSVSIDEIKGDIDEKETNIKTSGEVLKGKMEKAKNIDQVFGVVGNILTLGLKDKIKHAGEKDLDTASNYNSSEIEKHKGKMKNYSEDKLREKMNDYSLSGHERSAAAMILMEQGKLTQEEAEFEKETITNKYTGAFGKDNNVMAQLESSLNSNYQGLTKLFTDLKNTLKPISGETDEQKRDREAKHEATKNKIVKGIVNGTIKIEDINDQESLDLIMPKLADTIAPANFKAMVGRQTAGQKTKLELALKTVGEDPSIQNKGARFQLANLKKNLNSLNDYEKEEYISKISQEQMIDLTSSTEGLNSLKEFFRETGRLKQFQEMDSETLGEALSKITKNMKFNNGPISRGILDNIIGNIKED